MSKVRAYTDAQLINRAKSLHTFVSIPEKYWIIGVRSNEDEANVFDDKFYVFYGQNFHSVMSGTTNPGVTILKNHLKYNPQGAAILAADRWYYNVWQYGLHRGKMPALLQLGAQVYVYRDGDKDDRSEELGVAKPGFYGINFHLNSYDLNNKVKKTYINDWSAGCQVPNEADKYKTVIENIRQEKKLVSYCLLNEF